MKVGGQPEMTLNPATSSSHFLQNPEFRGWPGAKPLRPGKNRELVPGWFVNYSDPPVAASTRFTPLAVEPEASGVRIEVERPARWIRLFQPLARASDGIAGMSVQLALEALVQSDDEQLRLEWVALLTEDKAYQSFAQRLIRPPPVIASPWHISSTHRIAEYRTDRPLLLALQFTGGPGSVQLSALRLEPTSGEPTRSVLPVMKPDAKPVTKPDVKADVKSVAAVPKAEAIKAETAKTEKLAEAGPKVGVESAAMPLPRVAIGGTTIIGALEEVTLRVVTGWAHDPARPRMPVSVDLLVDGVLVARTICQRSRPAMLIGEAGTADCAFELPTPPQLLDGKPHVVSLQPTNLDMPLGNAPIEVHLPHVASKLPPDAGHGMARRLQPLTVFAWLSHADPDRVAGVALDGLLSPVPMPVPLDLMAYRSLDDDFAAGVVQFQDLWFADEENLLVRVGSAPTSSSAPVAPVLRFLQVDVLTGEVQEVARESLSPQGMSILPVPLLNAFAPLLVVAHSADGGLLGTSLLPFPSLCRGGLHAGEISALSPGAGGLADLRAMADALAVEAVGLGQAQPAPSLALLEVDLLGATGTAPIFSRAFQTWLAGIMGLRLAAAPSATEDAAPEGTDARAYLSQALGQIAYPRAVQARIAEREAVGTVRLRLPADALPSLSVLASRRLRRPAPGQVVAGMMVIADPVDGRPAWSIAFPPFDLELLAMQPAQAPVCVPFLTGHGEEPPARAAQAALAAGTTAELPLAIRFMAPRIGAEVQTALPVALDTALPVLRRRLTSAERSAATVTALLPADVEADAAIAFLESLRLQTLADGCEVVALIDAERPQRTEALRAVLGRLFPGAFTLLDSAKASPSAALNEAALRARGRHLLMAAEPVLLHAPGTLETLATLLTDQRAASAGCTLIGEVAGRKGVSFAVHSGGVFPSEIALTRVPNLVFDEPHAEVALPAATYPVAANRFRLALVSRRAWQSLGGVDAARFPHQQADLDFALRALSAGWRHLCTSAISVTALSARLGHAEADPIAAGFLPLARWQDLAGSVTLLRALR